MTPDERIAALERQVERLTYALENHSHGGFDRTKDLGILSNPQKIAADGDLVVWDGDSGRKVRHGGPVPNVVPVGGPTAIQVSAGGSFTGSSTYFSFDFATNTFQILDGTANAVTIEPSGSDWLVQSHLTTGNLVINGGKNLKLNAGNGDVLTGNSSVLSTNATKGFLQIPYMSGAPSGTPAISSGYTVPIFYDATNNDLYVYNGAWKKVHLA